jgi:hypothetical protein
VENALLHWPAAGIEIAPGRGAGPVYAAVVGPRAHRSWREAGSVPLQLDQPRHHRGIDNTEIIDTVHASRAPMVPVRGCA